MIVVNKLEALLLLPSLLHLHQRVEGSRWLQFGPSRTQPGVSHECASVVWLKYSLINTPPTLCQALTPPLKQSDVSLLSNCGKVQQRQL